MKYKHIWSRRIKCFPSLLSNQSHDAQHGEEGEGGAEEEGGSGAISLPEPAGDEAGG